MAADAHQRGRSPRSERPYSRNAVLHPRPAAPRRPDADAGRGSAASPSARRYATSCSRCCGRPGTRRRSCPGPWADCPVPIRVIYRPVIPDVVVEIEADQTGPRELGRFRHRSACCASAATSRPTTCPALPEPQGLGGSVRECAVTAPGGRCASLARRVPPHRAGLAAQLHARRRWSVPGRTSTGETAAGRTGSGRRRRSAVVCTGCGTASTAYVSCHSAWSSIRSGERGCVLHAHD